MTREEISEKLRLHKRWLNNKEGGEMADLARTNLRGADLTGADLTRVDLTRADLTRAYMTGADLTGADLRGADLTAAKGIHVFGPMPTSGQMIYAVKHGESWKVQAGCFFGTLDELEAKVNASHKCPFYLGIINLLRNTK